MSNTKLIIINSPNNPTGAVYSEQEIKEIAKIAEEKGFNSREHVEAKIKALEARLAYDEWKAKYLEQEVIDKYYNEKNELLYNGFFFGEEDYEFSLRMRNQSVQMVCVPRSLVYHKVGSSQKNTKDSRGLGRIYMYYHNRLICNRLYEPRLKFYLICLLNSITCLKYFKSYSGSFRTAVKLLRRLIKDVFTKNSFDYNDFRALMFENRYFDFDVTLK